MDQHAIQSKLVKGIINARSKVNSCCKSTTALVKPEPTHIDSVQTDNSQRFIIRVASESRYSKNDTA